MNDNASDKAHEEKEAEANATSYVSHNTYSVERKTNDELLVAVICRRCNKSSSFWPCYNDAYSELDYIKCE